MIEPSKEQRGEKNRKRLTRERIGLLLVKLMDCDGRRLMRGEAKTEAESGETITLMVRSVDSILRLGKMIFVRVVAAVDSVVLM